MYNKKQYLHQNNKLGNYIKINAQDKFIKDFIDYIGFYGKRVKTEWYYLFYSDNGREAYIDTISLLWERTTSGRMYIYGCYTYFGRVVRLFRAEELIIGGDLVMKIDLYGKWILLANKENLRPVLEKVWIKFFWLSDIKITRTDYTCDCAKYNFRKVNSLNVKVKGWITNKDNTEYLWFGRKGKARFLRYYDKKKEIITRHTEFLYPEYFGYSEIMRYELQLNGSALDDLRREITVQQLKDYANFGVYIPDNKATHKKILEDTLFEDTLANIKKMMRLWDKEWIEKIKLFLESDWKIG